MSVRYHASKLLRSPMLIYVIGTDSIIILAALQFIYELSYSNILYIFLSFEFHSSALYYYPFGTLTPIKYFAKIFIVANVLLFIQHVYTHR